MHAVVVALLVVLALVSPVVAQEQPRPGGVFRAAMIGEPPTLDLHTTTAVIVQQITWHIYETLFTYDRQYNAVPMLAESYTTADGGRTYLFKLRRGVKFHNGKEMTAADVVASLKRWGRLATPGKAVWRNVEGVEARDAYTVAMILKEPSGALLAALARPNNGAAIYPKEIIDAAGDQAVKEYIGTGPYRFVEHRPDRHLHDPGQLLADHREGQLAGGPFGGVAGGLEAQVALGQRGGVEGARARGVLVDGAQDGGDHPQLGVRVAVPDGVQEAVHGRAEGAQPHQVQVDQVDADLDADHVRRGVPQRAGGEGVQQGAAAETQVDQLHPRQGRGARKHRLQGRRRRRPGPRFPPVRANSRWIPTPAS